MPETVPNIKTARLFWSMTLTAVAYRLAVEESLKDSLELTSPFEIVKRMN